MNTFDYYLQEANSISQVMLPILAIWAGWIALKQAQTFRLFELLKHIEQLPVRDARRIILSEIPSKQDQAWWEDRELEKAAAQLSAAYDHLGGIIKFHGMDRVGRFFVLRWGESILRSHKLLEPYLDYRRINAPHSYLEFTWLANTAKPHFLHLETD